ncbi:MAG: hypothetical protein R2882_11490 [Gemmatimonadales bacterium]
MDVRFAEAAGPHYLVNQVQAIDHNIGTFYPEADTLGTVAVGGGAAASPDYGAAFARLRVNDDVVRDVERYRSWLDRAPDKKLSFASSP